MIRRVRSGAPDLPEAAATRPPEADAASTGSGRVDGNGASVPRHRVKKNRAPEATAPSRAG